MKLPGGTFSFEDYFRANVEKKLFMSVAPKQSLKYSPDVQAYLILKNGYRKVPEQEDYELTPATRLLEKRREMLEVET